MDRLLENRRQLVVVFGLGIYLYFVWLMLEITLQYIPYNTDVAFLRIKQDYIGLGYYRFAFFVHAYSSIFCLLAAVTQFSTAIRKNYPVVHKAGGYLYFIVAVILAGPSGLVLAVYANGGILSQAAFFLLGVLWIGFSLLALWAIHSRMTIRHRDMAIRSFSLALSAITLRAWNMFIVAAFQPRPMDVYRMVAWLGWVLNLILAEILIIYLHRKKA